MFPGERRVLTGTAYRASERLHEGSLVEKGQVPFNIGPDVLATSRTARAQWCLLDSEPIACAARAHHRDAAGHGLDGDVVDAEHRGPRAYEVLSGLDRLGQPAAAAVSGEHDP